MGNGDDDLFDQPARWRLQAVEALGLQGEDRIAGLTIGAAYPDALEPVIDALAGHDGMVCDVGAGLGAGTRWIAARTARPVTAVEPEPTSAGAARRAFPDLPVVLGAATDLPLAHASCGAVTLFGVLSLVEELDATLDEAVRVLDGSGVLGITDLFCVSEAVQAPSHSPNVFRRPDVIIAGLEGRGCTAAVRWSAPPDLHTSWEVVAQQVDNEIARRHAGDDAFAAWQEDQRQLGERIRAGETSR